MGVISEATSPRIHGCPETRPFPFGIEHKDLMQSSPTRTIGTRPASYWGAGNKLGESAPLMLRLIVGYGFIAHGYAKLARGPEKFGVILDALDLPAPLALAWLTTIVELVCGVAVIAGAYVSLVAIPMAFVLLTASITVHYQYGFSSVRLLEVTPLGAVFGPVGYEVTLLYLACLGALAFCGAGPLSVDAWRTRRKSERPD